MLAAARLRMFPADDGDDFDSTLAELFGDFNRHDIAAARRSHQRRVLRQQIEVPQNPLGQSADVLQKHRLPLAVRPDDEVVEAERQLDNGVEAGKGPVTRPHFLDQDAAVSRTEQMHHSPRQNCLRKPVGGLLNRGLLLFDDGNQPAALIEVIGARTHATGG